MTGFAEAVSAALDTTSPDEAASRVHDVVARELVRLDPTVRPVKTGYFNHSYIPDIVVEWQEGSSRQERPVFLRHSLQSSRASGDFDAPAHPSKSALFMSLSLEEPDDEAVRARDAVRGHTDARTLITTVPALDEFAKPLDEPDPVVNVVRSSVIRNAKGFIQERDVARLIMPREQRTQAADQAEFRETVRASFSEEAVYRIDRVSSIVDQALSEEPDFTAMIASGQLTGSEVRELLPYLLRIENEALNSRFWDVVAGLVSLEVIERHWTSFTNLNLTPLVSAASKTWVGTRAQLGLRSDVIGDDDADIAPRWRVTGNALTAEIGQWRVSYAYAGTKLKSSGRSLVMARWDDLLPAIAEQTVTGINLSGVVTQSRYDSVDMVDMKDRIASFIRTADDSFHVPGITLAAPSGGGDAELHANFQELLLTASPEATLEDLTRLAIGVLGYRYPVDASDLAMLLGQD